MDRPADKFGSVGIQLLHGRINDWQDPLREIDVYQLALCLFDCAAFHLGVYTQYIPSTVNNFFEVFSGVGLYTPMPGQRAPGQKLVPVPMSSAFIEFIDAALPRLRYSDRAKFIRDAVYEKLQRMGLKIPAEVSVAPSRAGKGGFPADRPAPKILNKQGFPVNSKVVAAFPEVSAETTSEGQRPAKGSQHLHPTGVPNGGKSAPARADRSHSKRQPATPKLAPK
jgi:hypothetical protein